MGATRGSPHGFRPAVVGGVLIAGAIAVACGSCCPDLHAERSALELQAQATYERLRKTKRYDERRVLRAELGEILGKLRAIEARIGASGLADPRWDDGATLDEEDRARRNGEVGPLD